jgi:hypothetical protein
MRSSLDGDEHHGAEAPTVVRGPQATCPLRARCVPDRPVNAGNSRSLADTPSCSLTCVQAGLRRAVYVLLSSRSCVSNHARVGIPKRQVTNPGAQGLHTPARCRQTTFSPPCPNFAQARGRGTAAFKFYEGRDILKGYMIPVTNPLEHEERGPSATTVGYQMRAPCTDRSPTLARAKFNLFIGIAQSDPHAAVKDIEGILDVGVVVSADPLRRADPHL